MTRPETIADLARRVGARLCVRRQALNLSQAALAERLGTNQNRVCDIELGKHLPGLPTLVDYSDVYSCTVADLLKGVC